MSGAPSQPARQTTIDPGVAAAQAASIARYEAVLLSALDPILTIDAFGTVHSASRSVQRVFGYEPAELVGRNIKELMPEQHRSRHDDYLARYRQTGQTNILGRTREFEGLRKDGSRFPMELSVACADVPGQPPLFVGVIRDITDRRRFERETRLIRDLALAIGAASSLTEALVETLRRISEAAGWDCGEVWTVGSGGSVLERVAAWAHPDSGLLDFVQTTCPLSFCRGEGLPGRAWESRRPVWLSDLWTAGETFFCRADAARAAGLRAAAAVPVLSGSEAIAVLVFFVRTKRSEDAKVLELVSAAVAPVAFLLERKRIEEELAGHRHRLEEMVEERTRELRESQERLRMVDRLASIGTLAAGLGHDMNNVLFPVRCQLDALGDMNLPETARVSLTDVSRSVAYLQHLADALHLLAVDSDEAGKEQEGTDLSKWWSQVGGLLGRAARRLGCFEVSIPPELPPVFVSSHRLTQAVLNLIVNAADAIDEEGRVRLWAQVIQQGVVRVAVTDDGVGMTEEVRHRAMDPFFTTKKRGLGTGLGLALVHSVVYRAGGRMSIKSAPGKGTTVMLDLPAAEAPASSARSLQRRCAVRLSICDPRRASIVEAVLDAGGVEVERAAETAAVPVRVWISEPPAPEDAAERFLSAGVDRRIVVLGRPEGPVRPGIIVVENPDSFDELRRGVAQALAETGGGS